MNWKLALALSLIVAPCVVGCDGQILAVEISKPDEEVPVGPSLPDLGIKESDQPVEQVFLLEAPDLAPIQSKPLVRCARHPHHSIESIRMSVVLRARGFGLSAQPRS
jgi:hypothetical protein